MSNYSVLKFKSLSSTNAYIKDNIDSLTNRTVVVAEVQTDGLGRNNHKWISLDEKKSLTFSVLLKGLTAKEAILIPVKAAVSVLSALDEICSVNAFIKWPNDIIIANNKLCGILCTSVSVGDKFNVICGIGLNILNRKEDFEKSNLPYATSVFMETGKCIESNDILKRILTEFDKNKDFVNDYRKRCITLGKEVVVIKNEKKIIAEAVDITDKCELVCETADGKRFIVNSGEVSVRGLYGYV